jgi:hypothetical protein
MVAGVGSELVSHRYGGMVSRAAENKRIRRARERPAGVAIAFRCGRCGGDHPTADHGLKNRAALDALDAEGLRYLRGQVLEELASAVKGGADAEHLKGVAIVLEALDRRLGVHG